MKITASTVSMSSERMYSSYHAERTESIITTSDKAAALEFSDESKTLMEQMMENKDRLAKEEKKNNNQNRQRIAEQLLEQSRNINSDISSRIKEVKDLRVEVLKRILAALRGEKYEESREELQQEKTTGELNTSFGEMFGKSVFKLGAISTNFTNSEVQRGTKWTKTTVTSSFFGESEKTAYSADGIVKTADGREINFGVTLEMSRSFCCKYEALTSQSYIMTDPLVINLDTNIGSVSEQKFLFDIDSDGSEESISFAGKGSGFLALDKNGDGKINDGSELFGTKSGNGFKDLARYDKDGNGWIDEADDVFKDLKVWTKDELGNDVLMDLKEAGVGAIFLQNASTDFSLNRLDTNITDGVIRNTGVYLKENGEVGTIQHIDLAI